MAIHKTEALILRRQEIRETSLILVAFTKDLGKIHGLVKGVRGSRAAVPWFLEPLTHQSIILYERRRSPVALISSFDLVNAFDPIRRDLVRTAYAGLCLEMVDAMTETGDPHPEIFTLLLHLLTALCEGADPRSMARFLETQLLKISGFLPEVGSLPLSPGARMALQQILQTPWDRIRRFLLSAEVEEQLRSLLHGFFRRATERELKAQSFLHAIGVEAMPA